MAKMAWTPWHKVARLRDDLRSGELALAVFAADLYDVAMGKARPVYQKPEEFFTLTYPTFNLRELAKDVVLRLAGKNEKAIRQLELTYGGGKTHTLITLYHLVNDPDSLPVTLPAVQEFLQHIGMKPPRARLGILAFDKLDAEKGMEVRSPSGETRWLKHPWSVLAYQLDGTDGLRFLNAEGAEAERESAPAENLLVELLSRSDREGLATLVLIDEVLMFAREKVGLDPAWRSKLANFFQYLTQAATKVDRCAVVASLLATDPNKSDTLGKEITQELYAIFRREKEEGVQPVQKEDVAEVLRRRFFTRESIIDREAFRPHVVAALKGIGDLDEGTRKEGKAAEERYLRSYPFHPDLTEVLYAKWTQLEGFQKTRGVLRTLALALRDAERWDTSPVVGVNAFLGDPSKSGLSEAMRELTTVAATEEYEGKRQEWTAILEGELAKAREVQAEVPALATREIEQAVIATFLHSQPIGRKADTRDLMLLLGQTRPDKIEIEKGLRCWADTSWFLDEAAFQDGGVGSERSLPKVWRLGSKPNLRQMHHDACSHVLPELIEARLLDEIAKLKSLTTGASAAGARVHMLPERPRDIEDDGEFHFAVLKPQAVSEPGRPSAEARRFLDETTGPDRPRVYRNAVVLAVPSRDGLEVARNRIREYIGWEEVRSQLKDQELDPIRQGTLSTSLEAAKKRVPEAIQQAYSIVVTVSEKNEPTAFKVTVGADPLFTTIKADARSRIQDTPISAEALLPGGPYDLWREGEPSRRVKDLVGAFAQFPHLPKMLNRRAILETLVGGCQTGSFVLRLVRPDRSVKTFWRAAPDENALRDPALEAVLPEAAELTEIDPVLIVPGALPQLWSAVELQVGALYDYFAGARVAKVARYGYEEPITIPKADRHVVDVAVWEAVKRGLLWLTAGPASVLAEEVPAGILAADAVLQAPPQPVPPFDLLPERLSEAWEGGSTTALTLLTVLSRKAGKNLPWATMREAIDGAFRARLLEPAVDSGPWPCALAGAQAVRIAVPKPEAKPQAPPAGPQPTPPEPGVLVAEANLQPGEIQDLAEKVGAIKKAAAGRDMRFRLRVELRGATSEEAARVSDLLVDVSTNLVLSGTPGMARPGQGSNDGGR